MMKVLGWILLACLVLTVLRWAMAFIAAAILFGVMVALIRAPVQTLSVLFGWLLLCAFVAHPALGLTLIVLILLGGKFASR